MTWLIAFAGWLFVGYAAYNAGWFRGYAVGLKHGWDDAEVSKQKSEVSA